MQHHAVGLLVSGNNVPRVAKPDIQALPAAIMLVRLRATRDDISLVAIRPNGPAEAGATCGQQRSVCH